ncbi:MAG: hypothetical protein K2K13_06215 [Clostridiales bacterium]|nr:hypothetical protein [Clostridiales bacterium]
MKTVIQHETYGEIVYDEGAWTGKKSVSIGGAQLEKLSKKEFKMQDGTTVTVNGGFLQGANLNIKGENIALTPRVKWYEIALCILPFLFVMIWGNVTALCRIIPIVGGAIGGGISGLFSVLGLWGMKSVKPIWLKLLIAFGSLAITIAICYGIAIAILAAI